MPDKGAQKGMFHNHIRKRPVPGTGQTGNENRGIQTAGPDTERRGNNTFHTKADLPGGPDAGQGLHTKPFFLRMQGGRIECPEINNIPDRKGTLRPKSSISDLIWWEKAPQLFKKVKRNNRSKKYPIVV